MQHRVCQLLHFLSVGRGEEQILALRWNQLKNFFDVMDEAHIQHAVSFIKNEHLDPRQLQIATLAQIEQTTWGRHNNIQPTAYRIDLRLKTDATKDNKRAHI